MLSDREWEKLRETLLEQARSGKYGLLEHGLEDLVHDVLVELLEAGPVDDPIGWCRTALARRAKNAARAERQERGVKEGLTYLELPFGDNRPLDERRRTATRARVRRHRRKAS